MTETLANLGTFQLPCVLPAPNLQGFLQLATTGGTLAASTTYAYRVSALVGSTETLAGPEIAVTTASSTGTNTVTLSWLPVAGAASYKIYGRTTGAELFIAQVNAPATTYVDTGSVTPAGALPSVSGFAETIASPGLYAAPSGCKLVIVNAIIVSNPTNYAGQVYLSRVSYGGTGGAASRIMGGVLSRPDAYTNAPDIDLKRSHILTGQPSSLGDFLTGYATVPGLVMNLTGMVIS